MHNEWDNVFSVKEKWPGISIKSLAFSQKRNRLFGSGKGSNLIFVIDLSNYEMIGQLVLVIEIL